MSGSSFAFERVATDTTPLTASRGQERGDSSVQSNALPHHTSTCLLCARHSAESKTQGEGPHFITQTAQPHRGKLWRFMKETSHSDGFPGAPALSTLPSLCLAGHTGACLYFLLPLHFFCLIWATADLDASVV